MTDETQQPVEFDEDDVVEYDEDALTADDLYDVRVEAEFLDAIALASRVDIERRNALAYDDYRPKFGQHELIDIGMMLASAKSYREADNDSVRSSRIEDLARSFLDGLDGEDTAEIDQLIEEANE